MAKLSLLFLSSFVFASVRAASAVIDLTPSNFDDVVFKSGKPALVEFFAPWCGHCKTLAPIYEELAAKFAFAEDKVTIAKVDADNHKELGRKFGVQGFPTLKWFDGKSKDPSDYNSGRDIDSLASFVTEKTGLKAKTEKKAPSSVVMLNDAKFKEVIGSDKNVLVAFTAPWCGHCKSLAPTWESLAADYVNEPSVVIAKVDAEAPDSKATAQEQGVTGYPTIKYFPAGATMPSPYEGGRTEKDFVAFLNKEAGTYRSVGGSLNAQGGSVAAIDTVLDTLRSSGNSIASGAEEIKKAATGQEGNKFAEYYLKVSEKLKSNTGYVEKELKRLEGILKRGGLTPEKTDDLTSRSNILRKFNFGSTKQEL